MRVWFLTRSLSPFQDTGGGQIRKAQVDGLMALGWDIAVVMPEYRKKTITIKDNITMIPMFGKQRILNWMQRIGLLEDYLDYWVNDAYEYMKNRVAKDDIIIATSGGELGMIKLGSLLKIKTNCKFIINFHDPIAYSLVNNLRLDNSFHVSREKVEEKYIKYSDIIITSSNVHKNSLILKYPEISSKIVNIYFGYIKTNNAIKNRKVDNKINIAYSGNISKLQSPEILYQAYARNPIDNINLYFIGNTKGYKPMQNILDKNVHIHNLMPHKEFINFMINNIDIGFVSLSNEYLGACVPSKIYEYINLGLPIIGALPYGDAYNIINDNKYGICVKYNDIVSLSEAISGFKDVELLNTFRQNILNNKTRWSIDKTIDNFNEILMKLSSI